MDPFQASINATFLHLGIAAVLDPDGQNKGVKVLPHEEDQFAEFHQTSLKAPGGSYEIRAVDFAGFSDGTILEVSGQRRKVQNSVSEDPRRLKLVLRTVSA